MPLDHILKTGYATLSPNTEILVRDFELVTAVDKTTLDYLRDVDRLDLVKRTGTDRDESSLMWNAPGFDFDHDADDSGRTPSDIIYAYKVNLRPTQRTLRQASFGPGLFLARRSGLPPCPACCVRGRIEGIPATPTSPILDRRLAH